MEKKIIFQTLLKRFSPIAPKRLLEIMKENGVDICRDTLFRWANDFQKDGMLERKNKVWYYKSSIEESKLPSRQLIPALRKIAGIVESKYTMSGVEEYVSSEDMRLLEKDAEDYLREDPKLRKLFEDYRIKKEKAEQEKRILTDDLMKKLTKEFGETLNAKKAVKLQNFVRKNLPSLICNHVLYGSPTHLYREGEGVWFGDSLVGKGNDQLSSKIDEFVKRETSDQSNISTIEQIKKAEHETLEAQRKLQPEVRKLIIRMKSENH